MKAVMLAAGVGNRLYGDDRSQPPKALLQFGGRSLLDRHIENLQALGVDELVIVVGFRQDEIITEAEKSAAGYARPIFNPRYRGGPILSLWETRDVLRGGDDVLFMDADVLYHPAVLEKLVRADNPNCFLLDRDIEAGDDPVRLCIRDGAPVDFGKKIEGDFDLVGEWPGFMKMSPEIAAKVADALDDYVERGQVEVTYEFAMQKVLKEEPHGTFDVTDISGLAWIEIDFPSDLMRAESHILPRLSEPVPGTGGEDLDRDEAAEAGG